MAMQKSEELSQTVFLLFQQFKEMGEDVNQASIGIVNEEEGVIEYWVTMYGRRMDKVFKFSLDEPHVTAPIYKGWKDHKKSMVIDLKGTALHDFMTYRAAMGGAAYDPDETRRIVTVAFFSKGILNVQTNAPASAESVLLLERFAAVFEQTYIRFIDLKKAEAQYRESQIQLALERVRARTMAMQRSEELAETVSVLFKQLLGLGIPSTDIRTCGIATFQGQEPVAEQWITDATGEMIAESFIVRYDETPSYGSVFEGWQSGDKFRVWHLSGDTLAVHLSYLKKGTSLPSRLTVAAGSRPNMYWHVLYFSRGYLFIITFEPFPSFHDIFERFGNIFEQSYTRFLDLQKAEAQAREAQIETALEKVRSRSLAMGRSDELVEIVKVLYEQLSALDLLLAGDKAITIVTFQEDHKEINFWITGEGFPEVVNTLIPYTEHAIISDIWKAKENGDDYFSKVYAFEEKNKYWAWAFECTNNKDLPEAMKKSLLEKETYAASIAFATHSGIYIPSYTGNIPSEKDKDVLIRFANVFDQSYIRFLDLQKAEDQARESQIELGLERVRARATAMQKSSELAELVDIVFRELTKLDLALTRCILWMMDANATAATTWMANPEINQTPDSFVIQFPDHPYYKAFRKAWADRIPGWVYELKGEEKKSLDQFLFNDTGAKNVSAEVKKAMMALDRIFFSVSFHGFGALQADSLEPLAPASLDILFRFGKVFDLTYTRFNDLLKAEEQAREAHVEAALERVRSRTMAMQNSDELAELVATVFTELNRLEFALTSCIIWINNPELLRAEMWVASTELNEPPEPYYIKPFRHPYFKSVIDAWKQKNKKWVYEMKGEEKKQFQEAFFNEVGSFPTLIKKALEAPESVVYSASFYNFGAIEIVATEHITDEKFEILHRLGKVFDMSYTRFNDLKQAEAQAREARIEAALERVRSRTLAMQKSDELAETASVLFQQFAGLGILPDRIYIGTFMEEEGELECWVTDQGGNHFTNKFRGKIDRPGFSKMYAAWKAKKKSLTLVQTGSELNEYIHFLRDEMGLSFAPDRIWEQRVQNIAFFSKGLIGVTTPEIQPPETINLVERFAAVFNLSYTRFLDLQKAEAQAWEVVKRASVDRVRAEIASMRTTDDLEKITPLVWNELIILGVPFVRCGVFIMDDAQQLVHTFLSTPNGKAITAFHLHYDGPGEISQIIQHWRTKEVYRQHWDEGAFNTWTKNLELQGAIPSADTYLAENRFVDLDLHFLPFLQGMLYVGNEFPLSDDELHLVQNLADAFSTAYARYEDFNKLESAKKQIEKTLEDLKKTQAQLVQSEKMASLGELTAGIAHEIQNPLNFVNNFSEVSAELVAELNAEIEKGNAEEAKKIGEDLRQNLEKINHHGKRAGDIVKGMLMHSRTSSGTKEPTDLNGLADEYLRLAYHGLRAKDKAFNTTMKTEYDPSIGEINVIPQDIGRVILNLITNAFYAVDKRKKAQPSLGENGVYEPMVFIGTRSVTFPSGLRWVLLTVKDNGVGMPPRVLDKIFQPFFTTKPTGEGTGLGLSLSYDIVKAHGGEIKVETHEGVGSEFTIELPVD